MKQPLIFFIQGLFLLLLFGCSACSDYAPKPQGYLRIELPEQNYRPLSEYQEFTFDVSSNARVEQVRDSFSGEWFNLVYPALNAKIYCSYLPTTPAGFAGAAEASYKFVYSHAIKADAIEERVYTHPEKKMYGLVYDVKGKVASPIQFILTDSVSSIFRGSLYFDYGAPNQDSIAPVLDYMRKDIQVIIESFQWKQTKKK